MLGVWCDVRRVTTQPKCFQPPHCNITHLQVLQLGADDQTVARAQDVALVDLGAVQLRVKGGVRCGLEVVGCVRVKGCEGEGV